MSPRLLMSFQRRCYGDSYGSRQSPRGGTGHWESQPGLQAQLAHFLPSDVGQSWSSGSLCGLGPGWDEVPPCRVSADSRSAGLHTLRAQRTGLLAPAIPFPRPLTRTQAKITSETRPETREGLTQDSLPSGGRREGRALRKPLGPGDRGAADPAGPPGLQEDPLRVSGRGCWALPPPPPRSGLGASADPRTGLAEPRAFSAGEQKRVRSRGGGGSSSLAPSSARTRPRRRTRCSRSTSGSALLLQSSRGRYVWTKEHMCHACESVCTRMREHARPCAPGAEGGDSSALEEAPRPGITYSGGLPSVTPSGSS